MGTVFQGKCKLLKTPECKKYIQYSEKFQGNSVLQGKRKLLKTPECMQAGLVSQTIRSGTVAFKALRCVIEVAYISASVKAITVKFLENTTRKELQPLELTSKVTTEFAYKGTSRRLHKERYCRIDIISELTCIQKMPSRPNKM